MDAGTTDLAVTWTADDWAELYVNGEFIVDVRYLALPATHIIQPGTQVLAFKIGVLFCTFLLKSNNMFTK